MFVELLDGTALCAKNVLATVVKLDGQPHMAAQVSTECDDSDGDVIRQGKNKRGAGWVIDRFNKSPVLTWGHEIWRPSISSAQTRAKVGGRIDGAGPVRLRHGRRVRRGDRWQV
jgi:hypothetical protein